MSTLMIALACFGLASKAPVAEAASDKWTEDPTLAEDEIPMYLMGSIYTTFPNYYDNAAKADPLWGGAARMYPWNETRLRVAEFDAEGQATGKYFAIYFSGATTAVNADGTLTSGAGNNLNVYTKKADGTVTIGRIVYSSAANAESKGYVTIKDADGNDVVGTYVNADAVPADPSLSHLRVNVTDEDLVVNMIEISDRIGDGSNKQNLYNRMIAFDAEGRIIRGTATDAFYLAPGTSGSLPDYWETEFCYVNGSIVHKDENTVCDKAKVQVTDADGNPVVDPETGEPVMEETDDPANFNKRFVWQWYEEMPTNVNTVGYLEEGWNADLWDYAYEAADEGYIAVAFIAGEGTNHNIPAEQREVHNATLVAAGKEPLPAGDYYRACVGTFVVPAGGGTYDFGYLDKGVVDEAAKFNKIVRGGYLAGRKIGTPEEPTPVAQVKTYNFSSKPLSPFERVTDNNSYQLLNGKNVIEVAVGASFKPAMNVLYDGIASAWTVADSIISYKKDLNALEYTMYVNNEMVVYKYAYADKAEMIADFEKDVRAFFAPGTAAGGTAGKWQDFTVAQTSAVGWDFISTSVNENCFWASAANRAKWAWMVNYVSGVRKANGLSTTAWDTIDAAYTSSPGTFNAEIDAFLNDTIKNPGAWNRTSDYTIPENANGFLPKQSNKESFDGYTIDTANDWIDKTYDVRFEVKNAASGLEDSMTIRYVVVDQYTPSIDVNKDLLLVYPKNENGKVVIDPIDPYTLVTAYNGIYNGLSIRGDDITHNVHFHSDTLDFNAPTEGSHVIHAEVYTDAKHYARTSFTIKIMDATAPNIELHTSLTLAYGSTWSPKMAFKSAIDNVDGDLLKSSFEWCVDNSRNPVDTTKPGQYTVRVEAVDNDGNSSSGQLTVTVLPQAASKDDVVAALEAKIADKLNQLDLISADIFDMNEGLSEELEAIKAEVEAADGQIGTKGNEILAKITALETMVNEVKELAAATEGTVNAKGCKKSGFFFEILSAGCLLAFLLRKKH